MALPVQTIAGINTVFPVSAFDPTNPAKIMFTANWGDGSEEAVNVSRYNNIDSQYYFEFNKTYEFPGTYLANISGGRISSGLTDTSKQIVTYVVEVSSIETGEPLPVLKIADLANFADYRMFYLNVDDDGQNRSWVNKQITAPVAFGTNIIGYLSAAYNEEVPGVIGLSLSANQITNQNWPLRTRIPFEIIEKDNTNPSLPVTSILFRGYVYVYETATKFAIFL